MTTEEYWQDFVCDEMCFVCLDERVARDRHFEPFRALVTGFWAVVALISVIAVAWLILASLYIIK